MFARTCQPLLAALCAQAHHSAYRQCLLCSGSSCCLPWLTTPQHCVAPLLLHSWPCRPQAEGLPHHCGIGPSSVGGHQVAEGGCGELCHAVSNHCLREGNDAIQQLRGRCVCSAAVGPSFSQTCFFVEYRVLHMYFCNSTIFVTTSNHRGFGLSNA